GRGPGRPCGAAWAAGPVSRSAAAQTARVSPPRRATPTSATPGLYIHMYGPDPGQAHDGGNCYRPMSRRGPNQPALSAVSGAMTPETADKGAGGRGDCPPTCGQGSRTTK